MVRAVLRTKSVTTKVTEAEYVRLEELAQVSGVNMSEWMRGKLLSRDIEKHGEETKTVLAEVLALRTILINLLYSLSNDQPVTAESMKELIARADETKAKRAMECLVALVSVRSTDKQNGS